MVQMRLCYQETAVGRYPVQSVAMMSRIAARTEASTRQPPGLTESERLNGEHSIAEAISYATWQRPKDVSASDYLCYPVWIHCRMVSLSAESADSGYDTRMKVWFASWP